MLDIIFELFIKYLTFIYDRIENVTECIPKLEKRLFDVMCVKV